MRFLPWRRKHAEQSRSRVPSFGQWLVQHFASREQGDDLNFARIEQVCSNAGSLVCAAAFVRPEAFKAAVRIDRELIEEAGVIARRTGDAFQAVIEDQEHTAITWPWDHVATRVAWQATQAGDTSDRVLGDALMALSTAYAVGYREQLEAVLDLWRRVAKGIETEGSAEPDLVAMGEQMLDAYSLTVLGTQGSPER